MEVNPQKLLEKYLKGTCTPEEKALLESWHLEELRQNTQQIDDFELQQAEKRLSSKILFPVNNSRIPDDNSRIPNDNSHISVNKFRNIPLLVKIAAIILISLSAAYLFYKPIQKQQTLTNLSVAKAILPGKSKAILHLADGSSIELDENAKGKLATQGDAEVNKESAGLISYQRNNTKNADLEDRNADFKNKNADPNTKYTDLQPQNTNPKNRNINSKTKNTHSKELFNVLEVPLGATYQLALQDGTRVWLNAGSSIRFPVSFNSKRRTVELKGEAYFEVAKNKAIPFVVKTSHQDILVTGTHFNVMAYAEDQFSTTSLLEGQVHILSGNNKKILKPGQQSVILNGSFAIKIQELEDLQDAIAWKNGYFISSHENIKSIMAKIARWYNVKVEYRGDFDDKYFSGTISNQLDFLQVLNIIQTTNSIKFKIEGRRIIVMH